MKVALFSDVHGHLRLVLQLIRNWQMTHSMRLDAALIAGDLGCFPDPSKFDAATKRCVEQVPEEAGFSKYFMAPTADVERLLEGEFGVDCPILFVPGNHEDYEYLAAASKQGPTGGAPEGTFPVDCYHRFHAINDGAIVTIIGTDSCRLRIAGLWGIEHTRANAPYKISPRAVQRLHRCGRESFDLLVTHDAPAGAYPTGGSELISGIIKACSPRAHVFGHVNVLKGIHEFSVAGSGTKSFIFRNVTFGQSGRGKLLGTMGILEWDGSTAHVTVVEDGWIKQMRADNWQS
jgi:Icc-related predicted phosphoesterase